jgi:cytochrome c-type biogenesis protein CcmF
MNSNSALPLAYRIAASWGSHEGSMLLWLLMLAGGRCAVARFSKGMPLPMVARVLAVLGLVSLGFLLFTAAHLQSVRSPVPGGALTAAT